MFVRFRRVKCQLDALEDCLDRPTLLKALSSFPTTIDETYERFLTSIPETTRQYAITILQFLTWSDRPNQILEIVDALAVNPQEKPTFNPKNRFPVPREVLKICSSLVTLVTREDGDNDDDITSGSDQQMKLELQLAHFSVKEYLTSDRPQGVFRASLNEISSKASIVEICLTYLSQLDHKLPLQQIRVIFPLAQYCARYWTDFARIVEGFDRHVQQGIGFFYQDNKAYTSCYKLFNPDQPWDEVPSKSTSSLIAKSLYHASLSGLTASVQSLRATSQDLNAQGGRYGNALQAASYRGHDKIVQILLDKGANINAQGGEHGSALQAASYRG